MKFCIKEYNKNRLLMEGRGGGRESTQSANGTRGEEDGAEVAVGLGDLAKGADLLGEAVTVLAISMQT